MPLDAVQFGTEKDFLKKVYDEFYFEFISSGYSVEGARYQAKEATLHRYKEELYGNGGTKAEKEREKTQRHIEAIKRDADLKADWDKKTEEEKNQMLLDLIRKQLETQEEENNKTLNELNSLQATSTNGSKKTLDMDGVMTNISDQLERTIETGKTDDKQTVLDYWYRGTTDLREKLGVEIFYSDNPEEPLEFCQKVNPKKIKGLNYPENVKLYQHIKNLDARVLDCIASMFKPARRLFEDYMMNPKSSLLGKIASRIPGVNRKLISIDGNYEQRKVIPKREWFSDSLKNLDIRELLSIFPEAEQDSLILHIGRIFCGISDNVGVTNEVSEFQNSGFNFHYRSAIVLYGEPKIGKSTLMDNIKAGMLELGYSFSILGNSLNQFSFNGVTDDLLCCDDYNLGDLKKLLHSNIKSYLSGSHAAVEAKGTDVKKVYPRAAWLLACNEIEKLDMSTVDSGMVDRIHILSTKTMNQIKQEEKETGIPVKTIPRWLHISEKLGVSMKSLTLYLIRSCVDKFLETTGVEKTPEGYKQTKVSTLSEVMDTNREKYQFSISLPSDTLIPIASRKADIFADVIAESLGKKIKKCEGYEDAFTAFSVYHLASTISRLVETKKWVYAQSKVNHEDREIMRLRIKMIDEVISWFQLQEYSTYTWRQFCKVWDSIVPNQGEIYLGSNAKLTPPSLWALCTANIENAAGEKINPNRPDYKVSFKKAKADKGGYKVSLEEILDKPEYAPIYTEKFLKELYVEHPYFS